MSPLSQPTRKRLLVAALSASTLVLSLTAVAPAVATPERAPAAADGRPTASLGAARAVTRTVSYRGVAVRVPAAWPVVDLEARAGTCVRLDRPTVYLGAASAQQDCPARLVGRADTVWLAPATGQDEALAERAPGVRSGGTARQVRRDTGSGEQLSVVPDRRVSLRTTWSTDPAVTDHVVASATTTGDATTEPAPAATSTGAVPAPAPRSVGAAAAVAPTGTAYTGMGFDACTAPAATTMATWKARSPYAVVGIYIGGSLRGCAQPNLTSSWVSTVRGQGWGFIPIYVGLQAPCVLAPLSTFTAANAASVGTASAGDAVAKAKALGLPPGSTIQYDLENYATGDAACSGAVRALVTAWTNELHRLGYTAGVYGNVGSLMTDLSTAVRAGTTGFVPPDQVWYALWDGLQTTDNGSRFPAFPDGYWRGKRHHQYRGDFTETWGGVTMSIDANWSTAVTPGNPTHTSYGPGIVGPGSAGFAFTGPMTYWRPQPGVGAAGLAYWTYVAGSTTETSGATWAPTLAPGLYAVDANVPSTNSSGVAHYTATDVTGRHAWTLNQGSAKGYRTLGNVLVRSGVQPTVHLGDNDTGSTTTSISADAMRFRLIASPPGTPAVTSATGADAAATLVWSPAAANGSPVTSYTVTATPGGRTVSVPGTATQATMSGLTNGTVYTFTVAATNAVGTGAGSAASPTVVPSAGGRLSTFTPVRLLDTRTGTTANPRRTRLGPGESLTLGVGGAPGSPVAATATSAFLNITVTGGSRNGTVSLTPTPSGTSSAINYAPGQTVANLSMARLVGGKVVATNRSKGTVDLIVDVQGQVLPGTSGALWNGVTPTRLVDTRRGTAVNPRALALGPRESMTVVVGGSAGTPVPAGASAVAVNVTATQPTAAGYLTVSPASGSGSSSVNFVPGATVANLALSAVTGGRTLTITNHSSGTVQVVADVQGYAAAFGQLLTPAAPVRILDTRYGTLANPTRGALGPGRSVTLRVGGVGGSPVPSGAKTAVVNLTVVGPTANGQLGVSDGGATTSSAANFTTGAVVASLVTARLSPSGTLVVTNQSAGTVNLVADVQGYSTG